MRSIAARVLPLVALASVASVAAGCSSQADTGGQHEAQFVSSPCPDDVEVLVVYKHRCGYVTSSRSSGREVRVFVVVVEPPDPSERAPILETGTDLGMTPGYGGLAPIAQRTGRRTVIVDLPGTGHSEPSLACPEAEQLPPSTGRTSEAGLISAIRTCRARIEKTGLKPAEMTPEAVAEDLYAVMTAFDSPTWVLQGHGTTGAAAVQVARQHPNQVEALVLDSLVEADTHPTQRVDHIVDQVAAQCAHDQRCHRRYGDVAQHWHQALRTIAHQPLIVGRLVVDQPTLQRAVRWLVGPVTEGPSKLPTLLAEVASRKPGALLRLFSSTLASSPPLCVGYLPKCDSGAQISLGAVLSSLCPTSASLPDWQQPCRAWGVRAQTSSPAPIEDIPTVAFYGRYDPFAAPTDVRRELAVQIPQAFLVEDPIDGHNVLGDDCIRSIRNDWVAGDHQTTPSIPPCLTTRIHFQ